MYSESLFIPKTRLSNYPISEHSKSDIGTLPSRPDVSLVPLLSLKVLHQSLRASLIQSTSLSEDRQEHVLDVTSHVASIT